MPKDQLLDDFRSLGGKLISEKYQIINKISRKLINKEYNNAEIDVFINNFNSDDNFEKLVLCEVIRCTENTNSVVKLLKSEDDQLILYAIKKCTFFWNNQDLDIDYYINSIFPKVSYSNRMQIINMLAKHTKSEKEAEKCFEEFKNEYGMLAARPFLNRCTEQFILEYLKRGVSLTSKEIFNILPQRMVFMLKYLRTVYDMLETKAKFHHLIKTENFFKVFLKLLFDHTEEVVKIWNDYRNFDNFQSLGAKHTKRVLKKCKSIILNDPSFYIDKLHRHTIYKYLTEDEYKIFYRGLFPKEKKHFDILLNKRIRDNLDFYKSKEMKLNLLLETYRSVYNEDLLGTISNVTPEIMKLLNVKQRVTFAQEIIATFNTNRKNRHFKFDELTSYLTCDLALPKLKELIYMSSDGTFRSKCLCYMLNCCVINEDMQSLLEVLKYFNQRHRNELTDVRTNFILELINKVDLKKLNAEHWKEIHESIDLIILLGEIYYLYSGSALFEHYIEYNYNNNLPLEGPLTLFIHWKKSSYSDVWIPLQNKQTPKFQKICLEIIGRLIPEVIGENYKTNWYSFVESLKTWAKKQTSIDPNEVICLLDYKWICDEIDCMLADTANSTGNYYDLHLYLKYDKKSAEVYLEKILAKEYALIHDFDFLVKENPDSILRNLDKFLESAVESYNTKMYTIPLIKKGKLKRIGDLEEKLKIYCLHLVKSEINDENENLISSAIRLLGFLLRSKEFYEIVKKYYPDSNDTRVSVGTKYAKTLYNVHMSIAYSLRHFKNEKETFESLRRFCVGDYLKLTLGSLISVCSKSPFYKTKEFLDSCIDTPVSFKKHIIRLQSLMCNKKQVIEFLKKLWLTEKNPSIREIILKYIFNLFITEPNVDTWMLCKNCVEDLTIKDRFSLKLFTEFENVSNEYLSQYIELFWNIFIKFDKGNVDVKSEKDTLLHELKNSLDYVNESFTTNILRENLFEGNINDELQHRYSELAVHFIFQSPTPTDQEQRINLAMEKIKRIFNLFWIPSESGNIDDSLVVRELIYNFLQTMCSVSICKRDKYHNSFVILSNIKDKLFNIFDPSICIYKAYIRIQFTMLFLQNNTLEDFGSGLRNIVDNEVSTYGTYIIPGPNGLASILQKFLNTVDGVDRAKVISGLLYPPLQSIECALLAINLISMKTVYEKEYEAILNQLQIIDDKRIKIFLNQ